MDLILLSALAILMTPIIMVILGIFFITIVAIVDLFRHGSLDIKKKAKLDDRAETAMLVYDMGFDYRLDGSDIVIFDPECPLIVLGRGKTLKGALNNYIYGVHESQ